MAKSVAQTHIWNKFKLRTLSLGEGGVGLIGENNFYNVLKLGHEFSGATVH